MMKILKKLRILAIILICLINLKAENLQLNLIDFAIQVSEINKINILVDDSLKDNNFVFIIKGKGNLVTSLIIRVLQFLRIFF